MAVVSKTTAKSYFETGDKPEQSQFEDLIDSYQDRSDYLDEVTSVVNSGKTGILVVESTAQVTAFPETTFMRGANNLSETTDASASRVNIGLGPTAVSAGSYANADITVDELGRITSASDGTAGTNGSLSRDITQASHGLSVGDWVRLSALDYTPAIATSAGGAEVIGVVASVASSSSFVLQTGGHVSAFSGLTPGNVSFLSASAAGSITETEPNVIGQISKPLLIADTSATGYILPFRGSEVSGAGTNIIFTESFESAEQTITLDSDLDVAHGFSTIPKLWKVVLRCKTADLGYAAGDEVDFAAANTASTDRNYQVKADATNISIRTGVDISVLGATFNGASLTEANWRYVVYAWN